jgi:voltage-gated potassium channel
MIPFFYAIFEFFKSIIEGFKDKEFRALLVLVVIVLSTGTYFYYEAEGWNILDSFYCSVVTLLTLGDGRFTPTTDGSKIFTIFYLFIGLGILFTFVQKIASIMHEKRIEKMTKDLLGKDEEINVYHQN